MNKSWWWLISLGILIVSSVVHNSSVDRLAVIIFSITIFLFLIWFYFWQAKEGFTGLSHRIIATFLAIIVTLIFCAIIYFSLSWVKCDNYLWGVSTSQPRDSLGERLRESQKKPNYCDIFGYRYIPADKNS